MLLYSNDFVLWALLAVTGNASFTMQTAVDLSLQRSARLMAERLQVDIAQVAEQEAALRPNPEIGYSIGNLVLGAGNPQERDEHPRFFEQNIQTIGISQVLDIWGIRTARMRAASSQTEMVHLLLVDAIREIRYAVWSAFAAVLREQWEAALIEQIHARYQDTIALSRKRFEAGDLAAADLHKIELEGLKYTNDTLQAKLERQLARQELANLLAMDTASQLPDPLPDTLTGMDPNQHTTILSMDFTALVQKAMEQRPDVQAAVMAKKTAELHVAAQQRVAFAQPSFGLGYTHSNFMISGDNPHTLSASLSVPLPLFDRNQPAIAQAHIQARQAHYHHIELRYLVHLQVQQAQSRLAQAHASLELFENNMLSRAETALTVAQNSYLAGAISLLESLEAQRTYIETRANYLRTLYDFHKARIDMAYTMGNEQL